jgi:hypothetical protein
MQIQTCNFRRQFLCILTDVWALVNKSKTFFRCPVPFDTPLDLDVYLLPVEILKQDNKAVTVAAPRHEMSSFAQTLVSWVRIFCSSRCVDQRFLGLGTGCRWVVSFTSRPFYTQYPLDRRLGGPQGVCRTWRRENSWLQRDSNSDPSVVQPVASRYTDCAISAPMNLYVHGHLKEKIWNTSSCHVLCVLLALYIFAQILHNPRHVRDSN